MSELKNLLTFAFCNTLGIAFLRLKIMLRFTTQIEIYSGLTRHFAHTYHAKRGRGRR